MGNCTQCGTKLGLLEGGSSGLCNYCRNRQIEEQKRLETEEDQKREAEIIASYQAKRTVSRNEITPRILEEMSQSVILTTSDYVPGRDIDTVVEIVGSEAAFGLNIFKDLANSLRDVFGGRSTTVQNAAKEARRICVKELKQAAALVGADAVVSVRFDFSQVSSNAGTSGIFFVAASGTAVKLKPLS